MPRADAATSVVEAVFVDNARIEVLVHSDVPLRVSVPESLHDASVGTTAYGLIRRTQSVEVLPPPLPPETTLTILTVSGQRVTVVLRRAQSIETAVSAVEFIRAADVVAPIKAATARGSNSEPSWPWMLHLGGGIGDSVTLDQGVRSEISVGTLAACANKGVHWRFYVGACVDQLFFRRPVVSPAECTAEYCWAERTRNAYATNIAGVAGLRIGSRWALDLQAQAGVLLRYAFSGSLREYESSSNARWRVTTARSNYFHVSPSVGIGGAMGYQLPFGWRLSAGCYSRMNIPVSNVSYRSFDFIIGAATSI